MSQFPSPIYGASFKLKRENKWDIKFEEFPSPIYGASFKPYSKDYGN